MNKLHINEQGQVCTTINIYGKVQEVVLDEAQKETATAEGMSWVDKKDNIDSEVETVQNLKEDTEQKLQELNEKIEALLSQSEECDEYIENYAAVLDIVFDDEESDNE